VFLAANNNKAKVGRTCSAGSPTSLPTDPEFLSIGIDNAIYSNNEPGKNISVI